MWYVKKEVEGLNDLYETIARITSIEDCLALYQQFKGLAVTFPTKLISSSYVKQTIQKELQKQSSLSKKEIQRLAIQFDYSERQIRRFLKEVQGKEETTRIEEQTLPYVAQWLQEQKNGGKKDGN